MPSAASIRNSLATAALGGVLLGLVGCAGYQLGPTGGRQAGTVSIQVNPFDNQTLEPRLGDAVTASLRKRLQQDGTFKLRTTDDADIIVTGTIVNYDRGGITFLPGDVITPRDYRVVLTAQINARERATGRVIVSQQVYGASTVRVLADLGRADHQALALVAEDMARRATSLLVDGTW
jgi:hypothetical protein